MKVLITGGYGFIGSHVGERFFKEGYEVCIVDNLSTGKRTNVDFNHKSYIIDVTDLKCEEIFRAHKFDVVVHLAAQISVTQSLANPQLDANSNISGLVNMLNLSSKYGVKRFIYASSAAIYGSNEEGILTEDTLPDPISPYGISKLTNELYSKKWNDIYGLSTIGFRFSNVYGPRQSHKGEGGVISIFINHALENKPLVVYGTGEQTRDFIYVEEVADVIFRSVNSTEVGIFNLSTNTSTSVNELIEYIKEHYPEIKVEYTAPRPNDILHSKLDNTQLMKKLDWSPMYEFKQGLDKTIQHFSNEEVHKQVAAGITGLDTNKAKRKALWEKSKRFLPTVENLIAFGLTAWLVLNLTSNLQSVIDVKLFYITIIGILYGNRQSLLAVLLSIGLLTFQELSSGRDLISLTYDTDYFFHIAVYLFVGLVVGYTVQRMKDSIAVREKEKRETEERYEFLESIYNEVRDVKDELQYRILNSNDSYGKIYSITKELESLEPEIVFNSAVSVVRNIVNAPKVTIYRVNQYQSFLRLLASTGYKAEEIKKSLKADQYSYVQYIIQTGDLYINKEFELDSPLMAAPIYHDNKLAAIITVDGIPFENFSLYYQNLFNITTNLIQSALSKAFTFIEATERERVVENTQILNNTVFNEIVKSKNYIKELHGVPYLLVTAGLNGMTQEQASSFISPLLRETDYLGLTDSGEVQILLSNTSLSDFEVVKERLNHEHIELILQDEGVIA